MRIYLDKNVFSNILKKNSYGNLKESINSTKANNLYVYSYAHLLDLKNDTTDEKYKDLTAMTSIVEDNYLLKCWNTPTNFYLVEPREAFDSICSEYDESIGDIVDLADHEGYESLLQKGEHLKDAIANISFDVIDEDQFPEIAKKQIDSMKSLKDDFNLNKIIQNQEKISSELRNKKELYKELRRFNKENQNYFMEGKKKSYIESIDDFFEKSLLGDSFIDYVKKSVFVDCSEQYDQMYHEFTTGFFILNMLALDKEKNKKASFTSTFNDSLHAYYGGFCDILVTEDDGLIEKADYLYKLYKIDTKILKPEEFIDALEFGKNETLDSFQRNVIDDLKNKKIIFQSNNNCNLHIHFALDIHSLSNFKIVQLDLNKLENEEYTIQSTILIPGRKIGLVMSYKEVEKICNFLIDFLGNDANGKNSFTHNDLELLKEGGWEGRYWNMNSGYIHLGIDKASCRIYLDFRNTKNP